MLADNQPPKRIVITGASGKLGYYLCLSLRPHVDCIAVSCKQTIPANWATFRVKLDLNDQSTVHTMLDNMRPDALIHAAGFTDPNECEKHKSLSQRLNVEVTRNLARSCLDRGIRFHFLSSDLVFDGTRGNYGEEDSVNPVNTYGEHKAMAEHLLLEIHPYVTIFRLPWMFGQTPLGKGNLTLWREQLLAGKTLLGFIDEYRSAVSYAIAAEGIARLVQQRQDQSLSDATSDIYHLGGIETVSRHFLLQQLARLLGVSEQLIVGKNHKEVIMPAKRPTDVSLDSRKARALGYKTPFLTAMLLNAAADNHDN